MQLLWVIRSALSGILENPDLPDEFKENFSRLRDGDTTSGIAKTEGVSVFFKQESLSFATLFPTPAAGWGPALEQDNPALWEALAKADVRRALRALYGLGKFAYLDRSYLDRLLAELEIADPEGVIQSLIALRVLQGGNTWLDGQETELYTLYPHADLLQLLLLGNAGPWGTVSFGPADA